MPNPMLAPLPEWPSTSLHLHRATQVLGLIQRVVLPAQPNYLHLALLPQPYGVATQPLPNGVSLQLDFGAAQVRYSPAHGDSTSFALAAHSPASLLEALLHTAHSDLFAHLNPVQGTLTAALQAHAQIAEPFSTEPFAIHAETATSYADALAAVFTGMSRARARIGGLQTPLVIWPEHFDLATLLFHPSNAAMDEHQAHISLGFAPFTPDQYTYPYLYGYAYPYQPEPTQTPAPAPAVWHTVGWTGLVVPYDTLAAQAQPTDAVEQYCMQFYATLTSLLQVAAA